MCVAFANLHILKSSISKSSNVNIIVFFVHTHIILVIQRSIIGTYTEKIRNS